ncbi:unnamed protein product [Rotaria sordida]|uniref:G-protein coupled receptors family 1 profile domain-containing protein n=1 Tax=Rotaria sordida TaxID=392033 RepID=A0A813VPP3_9BILA|nr:unnamed protein product [Rotaria sordida]CAF3974420.1 unnamed protein product [Rotaria sordida]
MSRNLEPNMPSDLFYIINFSCAIIASIIGLIFSFTLILIIITNQQCHSMSNLLACNTSVAVIFYLILTISASIYGFRQDWTWNSPLCTFRAYSFVVTLAAVCYSFSIQSLSRLFFVIHYKRRYLLTWRTHVIMIIFNWLISSSIPMVPLFIDGSLGLEKESRTCIVKANAFLAAIYCMIMIIGIPLCVSIMVYCSILYHVRQSTYRILRSDQNINKYLTIQNAKRELKLVRHILIQIVCASCGGIIFLINVFWQALSEIPLPKPMYLLEINLTTMGVSLITIAHFMLNTQVKKIVCRYSCNCC